MAALSKPPTHRNQKLEQLIDQFRDETSVVFIGVEMMFLIDGKLTDDDMDIMAYYLLRDNT
ncbi:unnamed protein product, partial [Adineta steineri]